MYELRECSPRTQGWSQRVSCRMFDTAVLSARGWSCLAGLEGVTVRSCLDRCAISAA
ncbi:hypothetical protein [Salinactinospora qingdaonensis]|uniref:hypothetical protein n=1 Tax=Salinactinospora qingdaonensis TaxID=702744 RepID=UPI0031E54BEB